MNDFQKAVSALRSVGLEVTVKYKGFVQVATIKGNGFFGTLQNPEIAKRVMDKYGIKEKER